MPRRESGPHRRLQRARRAIQIGGLVLPALVAGLVLRDVRVVLGSYYALSIGPIDFVDPLMALQTVVLTRTFAGSLLLALILPVALALALGRVFCGWVCPYNTLLEGWAAAERRLASPGLLRRRRRVPAAANPRPIVLGGTLAAFVAVAAITGFPWLSYLSPPGLLSSQVTQSLLGMGVGLELALVGILLGIEAATGRRLWCRQICPVGALLGFLHTPRSLRIVHDSESCRCHALVDPCHRSCPIDLAPKREHLYPACLQCGLCLAACERTGHGALRFAAPLVRNDSEREA